MTIQFKKKGRPSTRIRPEDRRGGAPRPIQNDAASIQFVQHHLRNLFECLEDTLTLHRDGLDGLIFLGIQFFLEFTEGKSFGKIALVPLHDEGKIFQL